MSIEFDKPAVREAMKQRLNSLATDVIRTHSEALCVRILQHARVTKAKTIMIYAPLTHEADVTPIAAWALRDPIARRLCVPSVDWSSKSLTPVLIKNWDHDLVLGRLGLRQPRTDLVAIPIADLDVVLVPGLAFDCTGARLGRGGGFYDRFLATLPSKILTIGVAFDQQIVATVPAQPHDRRVQVVITESQTITSEPSLHSRS